MYGSLFFFFVSFLAVIAVTVVSVTFGLRKHLGSFYNAEELVSIMYYGVVHVCSD